MPQANMTLPSSDSEPPRAGVPRTGRRGRFTGRLALRLAALGGFRSGLLLVLVVLVALRLGLGVPAVAAYINVHAHATTHVTV